MSWIAGKHGLGREQGDDKRHPAPCAFTERAKEYMLIQSQFSDTIERKTSQHNEKKVEAGREGQRLLLY